MIAYLSRLLPQSTLNEADRNLFLKRVKRLRVTEQRQKTVMSVILLLADQQLLTGCAIMAAGLFKKKTISYFHWKLVVYLAWMSSNTHLSCLATLRFDLREEAGSTRRNLRIFGMLLLGGFLAACLLPTLYGEDFRDLAVAVPAMCFWPSTYSKDEWTKFLMTSWWGLEWNFQPVLSWVTLGVSYIYQILLLFNSTNTWLNEWLRARAVNKLERLLLSATQVGASPSKLAKLRTISQKSGFCLLVLYLVFF